MYIYKYKIIYFIIFLYNRINKSCEFVHNLNRKN